MPRLALRLRVGPLVLFGITLLVSSPDAATQERTTEQKIQNALSAAPRHIAEGAAVWDWPAVPGAEPSVLRGGSNGWTCLPSHPDFAADAPMCNDEAFLRLRLAGLDPEEADVDRAGISYMLQGGPDVDEEGRQTLGPHVMLAIPGDHPLLERIGQEDRPDGPYVADLGDDLVMLVIPVAEGGEALEVVPEP